MAEILDFSDLGQGIEFIYCGETYEIQAITNTRALEVYALGEALKGKKDTPESDVVKEEDAVSTERFIKFQAKLISMVVVKKDASGQKIPVTMDEALTWPTKLTNKVNKLINEEISGTYQPEEEKK